MIKGGENISPREIEEIICQLAGVAEVAVLGVPDATYQEEIAAYIVPQANLQLTSEQVLEFLTPQINKFKLPRYVYFVTQLPKNSNGKILKRELRDEWSRAQK